jgi:tetratricopeptide (TPR) repeat protein
VINPEQTRLLRQVRLALKEQAFDKAIGYLSEAVRLAHQTGDRGAEGRHLGNLALIYYRLGQPEKALESFELALERAREEGDRLTEDGLLGNMGNVLREMGRCEEAIIHLNEALLIANEIGDMRGRGLWLGNLGLVYDDLGQPQKAIEYHQQSVTIARDLYDKRGLASRVGNLGNAYMALTDYHRALDCFHEVVEVYRELGDKQGLALRLGIIGNIYGELGRVAAQPEEGIRYLQIAVSCYEETLDIARELDDRISEAGLLRGIGNAFGNMGDFDQAVVYFQASAQVFADLGLVDHQKDVLYSMNLAAAYRDQQHANT